MIAIVTPFIRQKAAFHVMVIVNQPLIVASAEQHPVHFKVTDRGLEIVVMDAAPIIVIRGKTEPFHDVSQILRPGYIIKNIIVRHLPHPDFRIAVF